MVLLVAPLFSLHVQLHYLYPLVINQEYAGRVPSHIELIIFLLGSDLEFSIHTDQAYLLHLGSSALCLEKNYLIIPLFEH